MAYTRKQVVTCISVVYIVFATGLAGYAASRANARAVPISETLTGFTTALPILAGLFLECGYDLTRRKERRQHLARGEIQRPPLVVVAHTLVFIYSTAVITLLGTHAAPPAGLDCELHSRWQTLYRRKDADAIRKIQDAFHCCGFINPRDMAWPFINKSHDQHACESAFGRSDGCLSPWKAEEQKIAGLLIGVVFMVTVWQLAIIFMPTKKESWLHRFAPDSISRMIADERHGDTEPRRAIDYASAYTSYSDRIADESDHDEINSSNHPIEDGNRHVHDILEIRRSDQPAVENEWARS